MRSSLRPLVVMVVLAAGSAGCADAPQGATTAIAGTPASATPLTTTTIPLREEVRETVTLDIGGREREYDLFVPGGFPDVPSPLVLDIHGALGTPADQELLSGMQAKAGAEGFIVAQPAGFLRTWDTVTGNGDDVAFLRAVVADVAARTAVDLDRVYATGMSNGGGMVDRLGCAAPDLVAAIAPVAGWYVPAAECDGGPVAVLAFHGDADLVVPYDGDGPLFGPVREWAAAWAQRNGCAAEPVEGRRAPDVVSTTWAGCEADVVLITIEGGGHSWPGTTDPRRAATTTSSIDATDLIWEFFEAHPMR